MNKEIMLQEIESLIRTFDFIQEEQAFIKKKLIVLLEKTIVQEDIQMMEDLHQQILNRETAIQLLRNDVSGLRTQVKNSHPVNNFMDPGKIAECKKFKQQVGYIETEFIAWKHAVNNKMDIKFY